MTREEAISILDRRTTIPGDGFTWEQINEAIDMAISALNSSSKLDQMKRCIEIVETQRDAAIKELENYMIQDALDGNRPCEVCSKVSDKSCKYCNPKWRGPV